MIKFQNTEKYINGLAELISQNPTYPSHIRALQDLHIKYNAMLEDDRYIKNQEEILKKAEQIGLSDTGYIFEIYSEGKNPEKHMIYKVIKNKMVCLKKEFETTPLATINDINEIIKYSKNSKIKKLISFKPSDGDYFHSYPWHTGEKDEDFQSGEDAQHAEVGFNEEQIEKLKEQGVKIFYLNDKESYKFLHSLEMLVKY